MSSPVNSSEAFSGGSGAMIIGSGSNAISAGDTVVAITALATGQISTDPATGKSNYLLTNVEIPAGTTIFGRWTGSITGAASNQAIAYLG